MKDINDDIPFAIEVNEGEESVATLDTDGNGGQEGLDVTGSQPIVLEEADSFDTDCDDASQEDVAPVGKTPIAVDSAPSGGLSLREFLFGDFLLGTFLRHEMPFILFLMLLAIFYISNRYAAQQEIIEEEQLRQELVEKKNYALTQYAELTMTSRQSGLEERLRAFGDSLLRTAIEPPYVIGTTGD